MRGDWLKIWIALAAALGPALDRLGESAGGGDVGADQHRGRIMSTAHYPAADMRVRFAPSPTGALHIGGARTALFNWLLAAALRRRTCAADRRHRPRALDAGERRADPRRPALAGARLGRGPDPPDRRAPRHGEALEALLESGHAYRSTATAEDVRAYKAEHGADRGFRGQERGGGGGPPARARRGGDRRRTIWSSARRASSTTPRRPRDRARRRLGALQPRGRGRRSRRRHHPRRARQRPPLQHAQAAARARGAARVGWPTRRRAYGHLPLLHGPDGKKLSKRHGRPRCRSCATPGYLPEAVRNYLALLGWGAGDDETMLSTAELVERFDPRARQPQPRPASTSSSCAG